MGPPVRKRINAGVVIFLVSFLVLVWVPWMIQDRLWPKPALEGQAEWIFWIQTFSGNWAPYDSPPVSQQAYAFSAIVAIVMNNALVLVAIGLVWRLIAEWRVRMKLREVFAARDQATKQALFERLPGSMEEIQAVFLESRLAWHDEFVTLFGKEGAERLEAIVDKEL